MLGIQRLDVSHLRGRAARKNNSCDDETKHEPVKRRRAEEEVETSGASGKVKKKARTKTWSDVVQGLKEDKLETTNSDKSGNESETADLVEKFDLREPNHMKAM